MQNQHEDEIQRVEIHIDHAKKIVAYGDALERLVNNPDFQTVIDQGYLTDEARRLTLLLGDPNLERKQPVHDSLAAIGEFHQFLQHRRNMAETMRVELEQHRDYLAQLESSSQQLAEGDA